MSVTVMVNTEKAFSLNAWLQDPRSRKAGSNRFHKFLECADGFIMSVQASTIHMCSPKKFDGEHDLVEVACPRCELLNAYDIGSFGKDRQHRQWRAYGNVPVETVEDLVRMHGGVRQ